MSCLYFIKSLRLLDPLLELQDKQTDFRLNTSCFPPFFNGTTWSRVGLGVGAPQYSQFGLNKPTSIEDGIDLALANLSLAFLFFMCAEIFSGFNLRYSLSLKDFDNLFFLLEALTITLCLSGFSFFHLSFKNLTRSLFFDRHFLQYSSCASLFSQYLVLLSCFSLSLLRSLHLTVCSLRHGLHLELTPSRPDFDLFLHLTKESRPLNSPQPRQCFPVVFMRSINTTYCAVCI